MRWRGAQVHGVLLVAALGAAWLSWTRDKDEPPADGDVPIWEADGGKDAVGTLKYEEKGRTVMLERRMEGDGDEAEGYVWGVSEREKPPKAESRPAAPGAGEGNGEGKGEGEGEAEGEDKGEDKGVGAGNAAAPPAKPDVETKVFRVNDRGGELLTSFARPTAKRSLGKPADADLAELELAAPEGRIVVTAGGVDRTLEVGMMAYGGGLRYVRDAGSGVVWVLEAKLVDDLKWADSRLVERALHAFEEKDVRQFQVSAPGGGGPRVFTRSGEGDKAVWDDETAGTWLGKLFRLRADRYVAPDDKLHNFVDDVVETSVLDATFQTAEGKQGNIQLTRFGDGTDARWYAVTERTHGRVGVSRYQADEVAKDLDGLLAGGAEGGEPKPTEAAAPPGPAAAPPAPAAAPPQPAPAAAPPAPPPSP